MARIRFPHFVVIAGNPKALWLVLATLVIAGCGEVDTPAAADARPEPDASCQVETCGCSAGEFLRCDGPELVTCGDDGASEQREPCTAGCNPETGACNECEPGTSACELGEQTVCGSDGVVESTRTCSLGCDSESVRCLDVLPSNGLEDQLDAAAAGPSLELPDGAIIDTTAGTVLVAGSPIDVPSALLPAPEGGVDIRVLRLSSLTVSGEVVVMGQPALAIVSDGAVDIRGLIRVDANGTTAGPGAGPDGHGSGGSTLLGGDRLGPGGGGFGAAGGGGSDDDATPLPNGGSAVGNELLVPLRGGGSGGSSFVGTGKGGGGGGAIQIVSRTSIAITGGGGIDAGGASGGIGSGRAGGAGGGILLESPTVVVSGASAVLGATGGGGGCSGAVTVEPEDGRLDGIAARGCESTNEANGGNGGVNGAGKGAAIMDFGSFDDVGGGGGGGTGRIRINTLGGTFAAADGARIFPTASVGQLALR